MSAPPARPAMLLLALLPAWACAAERPRGPVRLPRQDVVPQPVEVAAPDPAAAPAVDAAFDAAVAAPPELVAPPPTADRAEEFSARRTKSVVELQQWRQATSVQLTTPEGSGLTATFVDLNPWSNEWYLVQLDWPSGQSRTYHLENHDPERVSVRLDPAFPEGLTLQTGEQESRCALWPAVGSELELARSSGRTFAPVCEGRLAVRNPVVGRRSTREATVDFLRDKVWGGEQITNLVKETLYQDSELATSEVLEAGTTAATAEGGAAATTAEVGPAPPALDPAVVGHEIVPVNLGLPLLGAESGRVEIGRWYPVEGSPGMYSSAMQPRFVDPARTADWGDRVQALDATEASALVFMTAMDLDQLELAFDVGTDHPRAGWSERAPAAMRDARMAGPDGFDMLVPLVRTGQVNPANVPRLVATFTGGFKRSHGAFRSGPLSQVNSGSHYGWVEHGVVESRPMPGLATWVAWRDGGVELRTWTAPDDALLWKVRHLRQNGPPILQVAEDGAVVPGDLVNRWGDGNWSGSVEGKLRSVRASLCVQEGPRGRFLLYGYFSSATPSAMARVLASYGCGVAMLTDMNALEHTYLSVHHFHDGQYAIHHLVQGMEVLDRTGKGGVYLPRFVGLADSRDFFTVLRRRPVAAPRGAP